MFLASVLWQEEFRQVEGRLMGCLSETGGGVGRSKEKGRRGRQGIQHIAGQGMGTSGSAQARAMGDMGRSLLVIGVKHRAKAWARTEPLRLFLWQSMRLRDSLEARTPERKPKDQTRSSKVGHMAARTKTTGHTAVKERVKYTVTTMSGRRGRK